MARWLALIVGVALAGLWLGLGDVPGLRDSWIWLGRAAIFFLAAALLWVAYGSAEPDEGH